jgi:uncharacterized membrane protein
MPPVPPPPPPAAPAPAPAASLPIAEVPASNPGAQTSEFWLAKVVSICSIIVAVVGVITDAITKLTAALPNVPSWIGVTLTVLGVVGAVASQIAYTISRVQVKKAELSAATTVAAINVNAARDELSK